MRRHLIFRQCFNPSCRRKGRDWSSAYPGPAQSHPESWPVVVCHACGRDMRVTRVADVQPDSELEKALDASDLVRHNLIADLDGQS